MKSFLVVLFVAQVVLQTSHAQYIRAMAPEVHGCCACGPPACGPPACGPPACAPSILAAPACNPAIIQSNSVAATLADTLSLLTVSSLLAETLPLGGNCVEPSCGCGMGRLCSGGYGCGCGGCGGYYY